MAAMPSNVSVGGRTGPKSTAAVAAAGTSTPMGALKSKVLVGSNGTSDLEGAPTDTDSTTNPGLILAVLRDRLRVGCGLSPLYTTKAANPDDTILVPL
jgi:hypothetical protein